jgi:glycerate 2-kinase
VKIVIAPDSFKGSLTSHEAALAIERGVCIAFPDAEIEIIPIADGGEGTIDALISSTKGIIKEAEAVDPLGRIIKGEYGILGNGKTAVIEMAAVSGLLLLKENERNPLQTSTYGTGQLIRHLLDSGYRRFIIGIGGSSTNDCGTGMAQALGVRFFRRDKSEITERMNGGLLRDVASIETSGLHSGIQESQIVAACDVKNILLGERGCSLMYSLQKGASPEIANQLEGNMKSFIGIAEQTFNNKVREVPGAGAAGGLGAGLMLFLGAELQSGIDIILDYCNFSERIKDADIVFTGEGKIDNQTAFGKTIAGIARRAKSAKIPVIAFCGIVENVDELADLGVSYIYPICSRHISAEHSMVIASELLESTAAGVMELYKNNSLF